MKALWVGPVSGELDKVLVSLQTRWPDIKLTPVPVEPGVLNLLSERDFQMVFVYLAAQHRHAFQFIQRLRQKTSVPIVAIDASGRAIDRARALYMGCDIIINLASHPMEIQAMVIAALRRADLGRQHSPGPGFVQPG